ncbi:beta-ketoacyl synthase chain length factor [Volucribacter amazonae]|uniref:Beta-ketoacyl synthase-like N-terminal domain-containing protein n=1 Tax=Volucribacter amazonae TaxID=256731 RepID=A0A9X4PBW2_9PAST|nr:beta-ketoacyl synthase chain length factor [Volucribacter amazonae]MDG6896268.1 hypothetical protein [Volucribacter amazonae]
MNNLISQFHFNLTDWHIATDHQLSQQDWIVDDLNHWYQGLEKTSPTLNFLPPLKRRRLSGSARLFIDTVWQLVKDNANIPVVYASTNGEITRNFELWQSLLQEGDVSPTSFSLSVHNALVGQWSELRQVKTETTAISVRIDSLEIALLEAYLLLQEGAKQVLVVLAESPLSDKYNPQPVYRQPFGYALSFIVEQGNDYQLSLINAPLTNKINMDNALLWVRNHHLAVNQWQAPNGQGGHWLWERK